MILIATRVHSSGMRTVCSSSCLSRGGGLSQCMLGYQPPREQTPLEQAPPGPGTPLETCCKTCRDTTCNACWDSTPPGDLLQGMLGYHPRHCGQTHTCKNITFATSLQTVISDSSILIDAPSYGVFTLDETES